MPLLLESTAAHCLVDYVRGALRVDAPLAPGALDGLEMLSYELADASSQAAGLAVVAGATVAARDGTPTAVVALAAQLHGMEEAEVRAGARARPGGGRVRRCFATSKASVRSLALAGAGPLGVLGRPRPQVEGAAARVALVSGPLARCRCVLLFSHVVLGRWSHVPEQRDLRARSSHAERRRRGVADGAAPGARPGAAARRRRADHGAARAVGRAARVSAALLSGCLKGCAGRIVCCARG